MTPSTTNLNRYLNFPKKILEFISQTDKYAALCYSPKRTEFEFCALLAAWEATALHNSKASRWVAIWQQRCRKRHQGKAGRTLADPVSRKPLSERWHIPPEEKTKAYTRVKDGLRRVFKATSHHYYPGERGDVPLATGADDPAVLFQKIQASFHTAKKFACPEGLEVFLLTLIELFEQSIGTEEDKLRARKLWRAEIRRRRLGGAPDTKTLADIAPADIRLARQKAFSNEERNEILRKMLLSMRAIMKQLDSYLSTSGLVQSRR